MKEYQLSLDIGSKSALYIKVHSSKESAMRDAQSVYPMAYFLGDACDKKVINIWMSQGDFFKNRVNIGRIRERG